MVLCSCFLAILITNNVLREKEKLYKELVKSKADSTKDYRAYFQLGVQLQESGKMGNIRKIIKEIYNRRSKKIVMIAVDQSKTKSNLNLGQFSTEDK